jgi:hypothetical protein
VAPQGGKDALFQFIAPDRLPVAAGPLVARRRASEVVGRDHRIAAAAHPAAREAGQQVLRSAQLAELAAVVRATWPLEPGLARFRGLPELIIDDAQLRHILDHPNLARVRTSLALPRIRVLDEALTVPDQPPDVEFVVEDAGAETPSAFSSVAMRFGDFLAAS